MSTNYVSYDDIRVNPNARESGSVFSDVNSAVRNIGTAVLPATGIAAGTAAAILAGSRILGGATLVGLGACMLKDTAGKVAEAYRTGHVEGGVRHALYGGMATGMVGVGGLMSADSIATFASLALPAQVGLALTGGVIAMYGCQALYAAQNLYVTQKFSSELEGKSLDDAYKWLIAHVVNDKDRHDLELRTSKDVGNTLLNVNGILRKIKGYAEEEKHPEDTVLAARLKAFAVEKVKEAVHKRKLTNILLLAIAIIGISLAVFSMFTPAGWATFLLLGLSATLSLSWLTLDSSRFSKWLHNKSWEKWGERKARDDLEFYCKSFAYVDKSFIPPYLKDIERLFNESSHVPAE